MTELAELAAVAQRAFVRGARADRGGASALPRLAAITGAPHYDVATRKAAGRAVAAITSLVDPA